MSALLALLLGIVFWYGAVQHQIPQNVVDFSFPFLFALFVIRTGMDNISSVLEKSERNQKEILSALALLVLKEKENERK